MNIEKNKHYYCLNKENELEFENSAMIQKLFVNYKHDNIAGKEYVK